MVKETPKSQKVISFAVAATFLCLVCLLLISFSMQRGLNHDENQFITSGKLLSDKFMIPYKDYPYFHMPNLVFVYAVIFKYTDYILLAARIFSVMCASLTLGLIFFLATHLFKRRHYLVRFLIAAGSIIFLMTNDLFMYTSSLAWNHNLPMLFMLSAFASHCHGVRQGNEKKWFIVSGLLIGLAAGTRLTFVLAIIPFLVIMLLYARGTLQSRKLFLFFSFSSGILLSALPAILMFALAPKEFLFGNLEYPKFNMLYRQETGYQVAMTATGKLLFFFKDVIMASGNVLMFLSFTLLALSLIPNAGRAKRSHSFEVTFILILIPFLLLGSFAPTPSLYQYFYGLLPFCLLASLYVIASFDTQNEKKNWRLKLFVIAIIISVIGSGYKYLHVGNLLSPNEWIPVQIHNIGVKIATITGKDKVLTLSPIFPLEGGAEIYEEFVTGPFAWRIGPFLPENQRRHLKVISRDDLNDFLRRKPPKAILAGFEGVLEEPLLEYARENGYKAIRLSARQSLWVAPLDQVK